MLSPSYLLAVIFISIQGSCGEIVMTQTPDSISVSPGQTITNTCTSSADILFRLSLVPTEAPTTSKASYLIMLKHSSIWDPGQVQWFQIWKCIQTNHPLEGLKMMKEDITVCSMTPPRS
ncbi:unnamed protein product, partial [Staurois parvus]